MKQRLTLSPNTFIWRKDTVGLLYESKLGIMFHFNITSSIEKLCQTFEDYDNLYSALFDTDSLDKEALYFIEEVAARGFGRLSSSDSLIISLPPKLNIQYDIKRLEQVPDREIGEIVLEYLSTLTIYIGGKCYDKQYFKQIIYPVCSNERLDKETIINFLDKVWTPSLQRINLIVSDVNNQEYIQMEPFLKYKEHIVFYFLYTNYDDETIVPYMLAKAGYRIRFICEYPNDKQMAFAIRKSMKKIQQGALPIEYDLIVRNNYEYQAWNKLVDKLQLKDYSMIPVYDANREFFDRNVFLSETDIKQIRISRREIFAHQAINIEAFGNLTIMPDGQIYSDVTAPSLGSINDSIYELIIRELQKNYAWRKIRDSKTCKNCIYQWLCPSPSPYERAAGKESVCTFK